MKNNNAIIITSIIAGVVLIIAILALTMFNSVNPSTKDTLTVEGIASIDAVPDLISIYFSIETQADTSAEAKNANNEIFESLIAQLALKGFDRSELRTQNFNIYPNYEWDDGTREENGYKAIHSLKIELSSDDFDKISEIIDAGVDSGAGISYINFELSQELQNQYKEQALELASKDAKSKAEAVARGFGKEIGNLVSVQVSDFGYYPWNIYTRSSMDSAEYGEEEAQLAKETVSNIEPDEQEINARVSATYKLK